MPAPLFRALMATALSATLLVSAPAAHAEGGLSGAYLAARTASMNNDYEAAAQYYTRAITRDPSNVELLENALISFIALGDVARAVPVARRMEQGGMDSQLAHMVMLSSLMKKGEYDSALTEIEAGRSVGPLVDGLLSAWAEFGAGRMSEALAAFDDEADRPGLAIFGQYHKALALAAVGDFEGAQAIFDATSPQLRLTRRGVMAEIEVLSQLERNDEAIALLDDSFSTERDPGLEALRARLEAGEALPFTAITDAADGAAEVFFTVAGALNGEISDTLTLLYARMAEYLRPDHSDAILLSAGLLEAQGQYDLATRTYRKVPRDDLAFYAAELGRAETLEKAGKPEAAVEVLSTLAGTHPDVPLVQVTLGDMLRRLERYDEAVAPYDAAIALFDAADQPQWSIYFARGVAKERLGQWAEAEADFRHALELEPDQPRVLNYLGYSFVDKGENLDEALEMIQRAVAGQPNSGYITDSLGWAYYRLGRYQEAVAPMERAVELMPIDPIINDHLGDVFWAVGRKVEARFQWSRALSFTDPENPSPDVDPDRIRRKLEVGLDKVRAEEGAAPFPTPDGD